MRFKSYYVVWKQDWTAAMKYVDIGLNRTMQYGTSRQYRYRAYCLKFKSYYVVWKQFWGYIPPSFSVMFKSYYVVWKPSSSFFICVETACLNRTMQYGNFVKNENNNS